MKPIEVTLGGQPVKLDPPTPDLRVLFSLLCIEQFKKEKRELAEGGGLTRDHTILSWAALGLFLPGDTVWLDTSLEGLLAFGRSRYNESFHADYGTVEVITSGWTALSALMDDFNGPSRAEVEERRDFSVPVLASSG